jgi:translation initiation factor IF-2
MPVEVLGFDSVPDAGEIVRVVKNEREARSLAAEREDRLKREALARRRNVRVSLEDVWARAKDDQTKTNLPLIVKADVAGSLEALEDEIAKLPQDEITVEVIHDGVGGINESDVMLAAASDAVVIGFNVRPVGSANEVASREGVEIRNYSVIYQVIDELRAAMQGLLEPEEVERTVGRAEVRETFRASALSPARTCSRARSRAAPRRDWCVTARSSTTGGSRACAASRTTCVRSRLASSAASRSRTSWT